MFVRHGDHLASCGLHARALDVIIGFVVARQRQRRQACFAAKHCARVTTVGDVNGSGPAGTSSSTAATVYVGVGAAQQSHEGARTALVDVRVGENGLVQLGKCMQQAHLFRICDIITVVSGQLCTKFDGNGVGGESCRAGTAMTVKDAEQCMPWRLTETQRTAVGVFHSGPQSPHMRGAVGQRVVGLMLRSVYGVRLSVALLAHCSLVRVHHLKLWIPGRRREAAKQRPLV